MDYKKANIIGFLLRSPYKPISTNCYFISMSCCFLIRNKHIIYLFIFWITKEPSMDEPFKLSMGTQTLGCWSRSPQPALGNPRHLTSSKNQTQDSALLPFILAFALTNWALDGKPHSLILIGKYKWMMRNPSKVSKIWSKEEIEKNAIQG